MKKYVRDAHIRGFSALNICVYDIESVDPGPEADPEADPEGLQALPALQALELLKFLRRSLRGKKEMPGLEKNPPLPGFEEGEVHIQLRL